MKLKPSPQCLLWHKKTKRYERLSYTLPRAPSSDVSGFTARPDGVVLMDSDYEENPDARTHNVFIWVSGESHLIVARYESDWKRVSVCDFDGRIYLIPII